MAQSKRAPVEAPGPVPSVDIDALADKFVSEKEARIHSCKVCESEYCELIEELLLRGGGGQQIARFLQQELGYQISGSTIVTHARQHVVS